MLSKIVNRFFAFGVIIAVLLSLCSCKVNEKELKIFSNIQECENIADLKTENACVEIYESPKQDKSLKDLEYQDFLDVNIHLKNLILKYLHTFFQMKKMLCNIL